MSIETWKSLTTGLGLGGLLLAACDPVGAPDGPDVAQPTTGEGATETGDTDPGGAEGQVPAETEDTGQTTGEPAEPEACDEWGASRSCTTDGGVPGIQYCDWALDGGPQHLEWGACLDDAECELGDTMSCGFCPGGEESGGDCDYGAPCVLLGGVPYWDEEVCDTPLVLSFDARPAELVPARAATFDLDVSGGCITTDWPAATTPWLALDVDGNGAIDSGRELFGSGTRLRSGKRAEHGFMALAELDGNGDGRIDASDEAFGRLVLWGDEDGDRRSSFAEALPLSHHGILSVELEHTIDRQCDERGNCGIERAAFHFVDEHGAVRRGEVVDLHLACQ